ncbi:hypothetical protein SCLCIDRAFT_128233, partial [Scleroderma citrinum Foug A]
AGLSVMFAKILADHQAQYIAQWGDAKAQSQILHDCWDQILKTPQANHPNIVLPDSIRAAIRKKFIKCLSDSDREDEEAAIEALETKSNHTKISAEEWKAAAQPHKAGEYKREWDAFRAAC